MEASRTRDRREALKLNLRLTTLWAVALFLSLLYHVILKVSNAKQKSLFLRGILALYICLFLTDNIDIIK